jgi:hypothetical protein
MNQKTSGQGYHIVNGFIRPFTKRGIISFAAAFVLALIPVLQIFVFSHRLYVR